MYLHLFRSLRLGFESNGVHELGLVSRGQTNKIRSYLYLSSTYSSVSLGRSICDHYVFEILDATT
jgi:hypothetical protein